MDYKKANRTYLYMIVTTMLLVLMLLFVVPFLPNGLSIVVNNFLCELAILIPTAAMVLYHNDRFLVLVPFRKIRISTALLVVLFTFLIFPLSNFVNALSMLFVDNAVESVSDQVLAEPLGLMLLSIGLFGPFVEEFVFRGVIFSSYKRTGQIVGAIILSSALFGMMHMNFNQFAYGMAMGIMLALLVEATGSILSSFLAHAVFNSTEVIMMFMSAEMEEVVDSGIGEAAISDAMYLVLLFVSAIFSTFLAVLVLRWMAKIEGRLEYFVSIPKKRGQGFKLVTFGLVGAVFLTILYMVLAELSLI